MMGDKEHWKAGDRAVLKGTVIEARPGHILVRLDGPARGPVAEAWVQTKVARRAPGTEQPEPEPEQEETGPGPVPYYWHDDLCQAYRSQGVMPCSCSQVCRCRACKAVKRSASA